MKKVIAILLIVMLSTSVYFYTFAKNNSYSKNENLEFSMNTTPANEVAITKKLKEDGKIKNDATSLEIEKIVNNYIEDKTSTIDTEQDKKVLMNELESVKTKNKSVKYNFVKNLYKDRLSEGKKTKETKYENEPKLLVLLANFGDDEYGSGPLNNQIPKPAENDTSSFWVDDFSKEHFKDMLFTIGGYTATNHRNESLKLGSMTDYYLEQSGNSMKIDGDVYGWFTLPNSESFYGDDDPEAGGHDNLLPGTPRTLVKDLLTKARETVPFEDYDIEDPQDLDSDGITKEPDGVIDHLVIVHSGIDQSGGGGEQGDNAIWAHSASVFESFPSDNPTSDNFPGQIIASNYIIQGEDSSIGVFCHEFCHDLGLPDDYDIQYSTKMGEPVGFYSLMSGGSWTGEPLGTKPVSITPWGRMKLGELHGGKWVQPTEVDVEDLSRLGNFYKIDKSNNIKKSKNEQTVKVNLPQYKFVLNEPKSGEYEWYSGKENEINNSITTTVTLPDSSNLNLSYDLSYDIEEGWDFAFVQVSKDNGATWVSLESDKMTSNTASEVYPAIQENLPGYTGNSNGWTSDSVDLSSYAGKEVMIKFSYMTDWGYLLDGIFLDNIKLTSGNDIIFEDGAETDETIWTIDGFKRLKGYEMKDHYYMLEWKANDGSDDGLNYCYSKNDTGELDYFSTEKGLIVWYKNDGYTDNIVGVHPGLGALGIVDSHPEPFTTTDGSIPRTRIQIHDAAFNKNIIPSKTFIVGDTILKTSPSRGANLFSDSNKYLYESSPYSGLELFQYGLNVKVLGSSRHDSVGYIRVYKN
ncbi:MAG: immune inhibitor A domain-containing protein [Clostridiales bacterium]